MKKVLFLMGILLAMHSCSDTNKNLTPIEQLPEATQTGENTFGFLVNGDPINVTNTSQQVAIYQQGQLQLGGGGVNINISETLNTYVQYNLIDRSRYQVDSNPELGCSYQFEDTYEGNVTFTKIDQTNYIISGTFEFSTKNDLCEDIKITNGRFDLKYIP